ncbi:GntR family transcriptional regulator [Pseudonocardia sp.]|uniref:GntR family transcriptional regulator n=1 Tax=Pseudonocardia sp. TaxID=60912 RepID=UPI003D09FD07
MVAPGRSPQGDKSAPGALGGTGKLGARRQLSAEVEEHVREMILTGQLRPGELLNAERLADELGVSQTPVREGLQALRSQGFLTLEPYRGFRVVGLRRADLKDIFAVQAYLSAELARRATARMSSAQIDELARIQDELTAAAERDDGDTVQELHFAFNRMINHAADAPKLALLLAIALRHVPRNFFRAHHVYPAAERRTEIVDAIRRRDADAAALAMRRYIEHIGEVLEAFLDSGGALTSG